MASLHIADLRSKYSLTGLDLTELRAVWSCLPKSFGNDPGGQKASWRDNCLETIMDLVQKEELGQLSKEKIRNRIYYKGGPLRGPFDPEAPLHSVQHTESDAFKPTPQFESVQRIDSNSDLASRKARLMHQTTTLRRQVDQFSDIRKVGGRSRVGVVGVVGVVGGVGVVGCWP